MIELNLFGDLPRKLTDNITVIAVRHHSKASEAYVDVELSLPGGSKWKGSIPVNYRRTGRNASSVEDCQNLIEEARLALAPDRMAKWEEECTQFWSGTGNVETKGFFDVLVSNIGMWTCQNCKLPANPNWARRTQKLKELGFTLATDISIVCPTCKSKKTHLMLLPIPQGVHGGYEYISKKLRKKILKTLQSYDAYEGRKEAVATLLPDHKFPEIRWDADTKEENPEDMSADEIIRKFQLVSNQRNEQKREICRKCYQTGKRGTPFGIVYFYSGNENWPAAIPKVGKGAESGCFGCGWYDLEKWRSELNQTLIESEKDK